MIFGDLTSPDIGRIAATKVAVLPLAAVEQHGDHLPVVTDSAIVTELACRVERQLSDHIVLLPTLWAGCSHHHLRFPGTLSLSSDTYVLVICDLVESLLSSGFRRIFLLNGHGGNQIPFSEALYRLALKRSGAKIAAQSYWRLAARELSAQNFMSSPNLTHACEYETSMMLALRNDWVKMEKAAGAHPKRDSAFYDPMGYVPSRVFVSETFESLSPNGALGSPELATAEKGQHLLEIIETCVVGFLRDFSQWPTE